VAESRGEAGRRPSLDSVASLHMMRGRPAGTRSREDIFTVGLTPKRGTFSKSVDIVALACPGFVSPPPDAFICDNIKIYQTPSGVRGL